MYNQRMRRSVRAVGLAGLAAAVLVTAASVRAQQQPPPVPQPFPKAGGSNQQPAQPPQPPPATAQAPSAMPAPPPGQAASTSASASGAEVAAKLGLPVYPAAQFIASYDAGRGQRYYLFGSTAPFNDLVSYYRSVLKQRGTMVFDSPGTYEFDVGKFDEDAMAFPPGVTIKDFQSQISGGYPNPKPGGQPAFFPSIIQIVPAPAPQAKP
jgi:hypothetical protein